MGQLDLKYFESVTTNGKLPAKYGNLRKRSEEDKIVFAFVSDYFYRFHFHFFDYRYHFRLVLKIRKNLKITSENRKLSFSFSSLYTNVTAQWLSNPSRRRLANYVVRLTRHKQEPTWPIRR
jgi:hypothetical protein